MDPDEPICIACGRSFVTSRALRAHEAQCNASKALATDIHHQHSRGRKKSKKRKRPSPSESPNPGSPHPLSPANLEGPLAEIDELEIPNLNSPGLPVPPDPIVSVRSGRRIRLPGWFADYLPDELSGLRHVPPIPVAQAVSPVPSPGPSTQLVRRCSPHQTKPDASGLFSVYPNSPTFTPHPAPSSSCIDAPTLAQPLDPLPAPAPDLPNVVPPSNITRENLFSAFSSPSAGLMTLWHFTGSKMKTKEEIERATRKYMQDPAFCPAEVANFSIDRECKRIKEYLQNDANPFHMQHGWIRSSFRLPVIMEGVKFTSEADPKIPTIPIDNVIHRPITQIIRSVLTNSVSSTFHFTPFEQRWTTADGRNVRVYSEAFTSPRMLDAHKEINTLPREPGDEYERVVVPLMLWSDATQLANFGDASLWPVYLSFGSQSKYTRGKPTAAACHHVAYIPSLPNNFQDMYRDLFGDSSTSELYTHFKRELIQAIWELLLDNEFVDAYKNGLLIQCIDGIIRKFYPRFFSYSADYPEKVLLACIKFLGECPCPRCLVKKADIPEMGKPPDMKLRQTETRENDRAYVRRVRTARNMMIRQGKKINSKDVSSLLKDQSLVPTWNAFSSRLSSEDTPFNFFLLFVVDLLHEFELGVWKAIFTHLMRILHLEGENTVQDLDRRYRNVRTFGRGTIHRFHKNASAMKRLAARDWEDLLQCAIPVFDGLLLSPHNEVVLDLLFDLATWHALAKLRMHTEDTLSFFDVATPRLSYSVCKFQDTTCSSYQTTELPQESGTRRGRKRANTTAKNAKPVKVKHLNLSTYKYHALADYPAMIREYGTTDSYSTQTGELEHRHVKRRFLRSGMKRDIRNISLANQEAIERFVREVDKERDELLAAETTHSTSKRSRTSPTDHYHIAESNRQNFDLTEWLGSLGDDPAIMDFIPRLKDHLLARIRDLAYNGDEYDFSDEDRRCIIITNNKIFEHVHLRINYTTYDLRRDQDSISAHSHPDIMLLSQEDERIHPYWYARVCLIFHVLVQHRKDAESAFSKPERMDVLFVRWFQRDSNFSSGWDAKRLPRLQFFDQREGDATDAFGFVDPDAVIRGIHLLPAFRHGLTADLMGPSFAHRRPEMPEFEESLDEDFQFYYVNIFVDRDMFMRFRGGGVGHKLTRDWDGFLQQEGRTMPDWHDISDSLPPIDNLEEEPEVDSMMAQALVGESDSDNSEGDADDASDEDDFEALLADRGGEELDEHIWADEGYDRL